LRRRKQRLAQIRGYRMQRPGRESVVAHVAQDSKSPGTGIRGLALRLSDSITAALPDRRCACARGRKTGGRRRPPMRTAGWRQNSRYVDTMYLSFERGARPACWNIQ
jgi:hypothetical protein